MTARDGSLQVRVRQDVYFRLGAACPGATMRGRTVNFKAEDVGGVFLIESANRVEISDCDIWASSNFAFIYDSANILIARNKVRRQRGPESQLAAIMADVFSVDEP